MPERPMPRERAEKGGFRLACSCLPGSLRDAERNLETMKRAIKEAGKRGTDLLIFGEAFLSGFEALNFNYLHDAMTALFIKGPEISQVRRWAAEARLAVGFGFYENDNGYLYSSYLVVDRQGNIRGHYRRVSGGWRPAGASIDYQEGDRFVTFQLEGTRLTVLLCGDFWEDDLLMPIIDRDTESDLFLWPVHCDIPIPEWQAIHKEEYRQRSQILSKPIALVNNFVEDEDRAKGGAYLWHLGRELGALPPGQPGLLHVEL